MMQQKKRLGFTFIEVLTVIVISAGLFLGFIVLLVDVTEQMHISWQLREAEDWGNWYVNTFVDKLRNGYDVDLTRVTPPCEAEVKYISPYDYSLPDLQRDIDTYEFEYDFDTGFPVLRINERQTQYEFFPPREQDLEDEFYVDPESFEIRVVRRDDLQEGYVERFTPYYMEIEFQLMYRRYTGRLFGGNVYEKVLTFQGAAYVANDKWPVIKSPFDEPQED